MLPENLCHGRAPADESAPSLIDDSLELLHNDAALSRAKDMLMLQSQDKTLDVVFRARISAMARVLSLFLDPDLSYISTSSERECFLSIPMDIADRQFLRRRMSCKRFEGI